MKRETHTLLSLFTQKKQECFILCVRKMRKTNETEVFLRVKWVSA